MKFKTAIAIITTLIILLASMSQAGVMPGENPGNTDEASVKWYTAEEAYALNQKEPRKFFFDLYTHWCGWCKKMDATTFGNLIVAEYLNKTYYPVKFNAEITDTVYFRDKAYPYVSAGRRGYNQLAFDLADGRLSYPTIVFLDEQANTIQAVPGYRDAEELDRILKYFGENHYRTTDWATFSTNYNSPFASPTPGQ